MRANKSAQVLAIFLILILETHVLYSQVTNCNQGDLNALQGILEGLESSNLDWRVASANCCSWKGVKCENISTLGISGSDSPPLKRVVTLNLGEKSLKGSVPKLLSDLDQLQVLNLSYNALYGSLPHQLFNLQHLNILDLSGNKLSGSIASFLPPFFPMHKPLKLTKLFVSKNLFDGPVDAASLCRLSPQLLELDLSSNLFSGSLPQGIGNCRYVKNLFLNSNNISGSLPDDLFELSSLRQLHLQGNQLFGQLDARFQNLSNLFLLDISNNRFYGHIPETLFASLSSLSHFSASSNKFSGQLPVTVSPAAAATLVHLDLRNNSLIGTISINCTQLPKLSFLDLSSNQFTGTIPDNISLCIGLKFINLAKNNLDGLIPESLKNIADLSYLSLSNNGFQNIATTLQILQQCKSLTTLVLAGNFRDEEIQTRHIEGFENLRVLSLPNCPLHGRIPPWLSNLTQLTVLDLSRNRLAGNIPPHLLDNLSRLSYLNLSHNQLTGRIPTNLTINLQKSVQYSENGTGRAGYADFIKRINLVILPTPATIFYHRTENLLYEFSALPPSIDLSNNQLNGVIPAQLGELKNLIVLDLSWNNLTDAIPDSFSKLGSLELLDLSHNRLTGRIPGSLVQLSFLSRFNVSNNHLEGEIPKGGQFPTFPSSSFEGNLNLCGDFQQQACTKDPTVPIHSLEDESGVTLDRLALGVGAATGFLVTAVVSVISRFCYERDERIIQLKLLVESYIISYL